MSIGVFLYSHCHQHRVSISAPLMSELKFAEIERHLEETLSLLKEARDPQRRLILLTDMRLLLLEADRLLLESGHTDNPGG
jgi:hypothetical protein